MAQVTRNNIRKLAWINDHRGVTGLAKAIGRSRTAIYQSLRNPTRFSRTRAAIEQALPRRHE